WPSPDGCGISGPRRQSSSITRSKSSSIRWDSSIQARRDHEPMTEHVTSTRLDSNPAGAGVTESRSSEPRIARLRTEYGLAIVGTSRPRLSWTVENGDGWLQKEYELRSGDDVVAVDSGDSVFVQWPFAPLESRERRLVSVRAKSTDGRSTDWSSPVTVEAALL